MSLEAIRRRVRRRPDEPRRPSSRRAWTAAAAAAGAALAVALGVILGGSAGQGVGRGLSPRPAARPQAPVAPVAPPAAPAPEAPPGFVRFRDGQGRFSIAYPSDWARLSSADPGVALLATKARVASVLVRSVPLRFRVDRPDLPVVKELTDKIVASGRKVRLIAQARRIALGGLPGYFYLYSFRAPDGRRGTHSHYFLFRGSTMITIVLQALPERNLRRFARVFDEVAATFRPGAR